MTNDKPKTERTYRKPTILKKEKSRVSSSICGWNLNCGMQVRKDK